MNKKFEYYVYILTPCILKAHKEAKIKPARIFLIHIIRLHLGKYNVNILPDYTQNAETSQKTNREKFYGTFNQRSYYLTLC